MTNTVIAESEFTFLPGKVDINDIESNGKLLTDEEIEKAKQVVAKSDSPTRFAVMKNKPKSKVGERGYKDHYTVIKMKGSNGETELYAIYKGKKHSKELGAGKFGKVELMQNLSTGQWYAIKIIDHAKAMKEEVFEILKDLQPIEKIKEEILQATLFVIKSYLEGNYSSQQSEQYLNDKLGEISKTVNLSITIRNNIKNVVEEYKKTIPDVRREYENLKGNKQAKGILHRAENHKSEIKLQSIIGMELVPGINLFSLSKGRKTMPLASWLHIAIGAMKAIEYVHGNKLLHRDIKLDNLNYNPATGEVTAIDLGMAAPINGQKQPIRLIAGYTAPESRNSYGQNATEKSEVYSVAVAIAALLGLAKEIWKDGTVIEVEITINGDGVGNSPRIPNATLRQQIVDYLLKMTDNDQEKRPSLQDAIKYFQSLQQECMHVLGVFRNVGILNLDDYMQCDKNDRMAMRRALRQFDRVNIVDAEQKYKSKYLEIRKELEADGIVLADTVFHRANGKPATGVEIVRSIPEILIKKPTNTQNIDNYFYVAPANAAKNMARLNQESVADSEVGIIEVGATKSDVEYKHLSRVISSQQLGKIIELLQSDRNRVQERVEKEKSTGKKLILNSRVELIQKEIVHLQEIQKQPNRNSMSYAKAIERLKSLETKFESTNALTRMLTKRGILKNTTDSAKVVGKLNKELLVSDNHKDEEINFKTKK